jgi:hypothetical protein
MAFAPFGHLPLQCTLPDFAYVRKIKPTLESVSPTQGEARPPFLPAGLGICILDLFHAGRKLQLDLAQPVSSWAKGSKGLEARG